MKYLLCLVLVCLSGAHPLLSERAGSAPLTRIDPEIWRILARLRQPVSPEERQQVRDDLYAVPNWSDRLAASLVEMAIEARYDPNRKPTQAEIDAANVGGKYDGIGDAKIALLPILAGSAIQGRADAARAELHHTLGVLTSLRDENSIRFIAPLLAERSEEIVYDDGAYVQAPQMRAREVLNILQGRMTIPGVSSYLWIDKWREWWKANRQRYEPIPAALAALEASEGGTKPMPAPATPAPAAPSPTPAPATPTPAPTVPPATATPTAPAPETTPKAAKPATWLFAGVAAALVLIALLVGKAARRR